MTDSAAEFDRYAAWTAQAARELGPNYAIPAGCRGSASPAALAWLAEALELAPGRTLLDVGAGVGGATAWAQRHYGVRGIALEPMPGAAHGASTLQGLPAVVATAQRLPLRDAAVGAVWALGVLDTAADQQAVLREVRRVLVPGGRFGLLAYVRPDPDTPQPLPGQDFCAAGQLPDLLAGAGLEVLEQLAAGPLMSAPRAWADRIDAVDAAVRREHGSEPGWQAATDASGEMGALLEAGTVQPLLVHARPC